MIIIANDWLNNDIREGVAVNSSTLHERYPALIRAVMKAEPIEGFWGPNDGHPSPNLSIEQSGRDVEDLCLYTAAVRRLHHMYSGKTWNSSQGIPSVLGEATPISLLSIDTEEQEFLSRCSPQISASLQSQDVVGALKTTSATDIYQAGYLDSLAMIAVGI